MEQSQHLRAPPHASGGASASSAGSSSSTAGSSAGAAGSSALFSSTPLSLAPGHAFPHALAASPSPARPAAPRSPRQSLSVYGTSPLLSRRGGSELADDGASMLDGGGGGGHSRLGSEAASEELEHERELEELEDSVRQSRNTDDFTRIIGQFRLERRRRSGRSHADASSSQVHLGLPSSGSGHFGQAGGRPASMYSVDDSSYGPEYADDAASIVTTRSGGGGPGGMRVQVRCTCCCGRGEDCDSMRRATREWADMESDLRLAAEIGQALLRRNDSLTASLSSAKITHEQQRDALMARLTGSIKESAQLERELKQCGLNLEAADAGNRALLHELDELRGEASTLRIKGARCAAAEERATRMQQDMDDLRQELSAERKRADGAEARMRKLGVRNVELSESLRAAKGEAQLGLAESQRAAAERQGPTGEGWEKAKARLQQSLSSVKTEGLASSGEVMAILESLIADNEVLKTGNAQLRTLLDASNEEVSSLREQVLLAGGSEDRAAPPPSSRQRTESGAADFRESYGRPAAAQHGRRASAASGSMMLSDLDSIPRPSLADEVVRETQRPQYPARTASRASARELPASSPRVEHASLPSPALTSASFSTTPSTAGRATDDAATTPGTTVAGDEADSHLRASVPAKARDPRTAQLVNLLDYIQRVFARLASADVDTLSKRLQRQHLTGDVGHLARTTVNGIMRDVDGLREHFRRLIEAEARAGMTAAAARDDAASVHSGSSANKPGAAAAELDSLIARRDFFALVKLLRDIFFEMARLRNVVNEVHLQPANAAKILQEQLGAAIAEEKGVSAWAGRFFSAVAGGVAGAPSAAAPAATAPSQAAPSLARISAPRTTSGALAPRASAAVTSTAVAVEVKGSHASAGSTGGADEHAGSPPGSMLRAGPRPALGRAGGSLNRTQSRNLSGLFAGAMADDWDVIDRREGSASAGSASGFAAAAGPSRMGLMRNQHLQRSDGGGGGHRPLSRIVDDDELSLHHANAYPERKLRPRGLSDSSIRSTFLEDARSGSASAQVRPPPMGRLITPSTLSLQAPASTTARAVRVEDLPDAHTPDTRSEDSSSTTGASAAPKGRAAGAMGFLTGGLSLGIPSLRPATSSAALSLAAARSAAGSRSPSGSSSTGGFATSPAHFGTSPGATPAASPLPAAAGRRREASATRGADDLGSSFARPSRVGY